MDTVTRIILCVFILGGIIALLFMNRSKGANYDERQLLYRGRAVSLAFGTLITFLGIVLLLNTQDLPWLDVPMFVIIGIILSLTVFIVYSILHDAYFSTITKKGSGGIFFVSAQCSASELPKASRISSSQGIRSSTDACRLSANLSGNTDSKWFR